MGKKPQHDYTEAEKVTVLMLLEDKFNGNISQCAKNLVLSNGKTIHKRTLTEWIKKKDIIMKSVQDVGKIANVIREDGSSIDIMEANRVKLAQHDNTLLDQVTESENLLFQKLRERLDEGNMSENGMFKFGEMIRERIAVIYKDDRKEHGVNNTQNNFFSIAKSEMKEKGII